MKPVQFNLRRAWLCLWLIVNLTAAGFPWPAAAQSPDTGPPLIRAMIGTWGVKEWMWPSPDSQPTRLPDAVAKRQPIAGSFLQEIMSTPAGTKSAFTRISYFGYNAVSRQWEYFSIDTRAPQMMNERGVGANGSTSKSDSINLLGGMFVAPQWGDTKNGAFRYRLVVGPIRDNHQEVDMYLTPVTAVGKPEFLAFKYIYTRQD